MAWDCSDCGGKEKGETRHPICHHCGKRVCRKHREMVEDDAFGAWPDQAASRVAVHCLDCRQEYHPEAVNVEPGAGTPSAQGLTAA